jgi:hypothetical protein
LKPAFRKYDLVCIVEAPLFPEICGITTMIIEVRNSLLYLNPTVYVTSLVYADNRILVEDHNIKLVEYDGKHRSSWGARFFDELDPSLMWTPAQCFKVNDTINIIRGTKHIRAQVPRSYP